MITLSVLYYAYLVIVFFFIVGGLFNIYHLLRFGFTSLINIGVILIFVIIASTLLTFSFDILQQVEWDTPIFDFGQGINANSDFF